jgi:hypothetical protein
MASHPIAPVMMAQCQWVIASVTKGQWRAYPVNHQARTAIVGQFIERPSRSLANGAASVASDARYRGDRPMQCTAPDWAVDRLFAMGRA